MAPTPIKTNPTPIVTSASAMLPPKVLTGEKFVDRLQSTKSERESQVKVFVTGLSPAPKPLKTNGLGRVVKFAGTQIACIITRTLPFRHRTPPSHMYRSRHSQTL